MANGFGGGFGGNMGGFTLPDFSQIDLSGIGAAVAKYQADEARKGATNQYEADVAEFKTNEAKGLEQGLGSLEQAPLPFDLEPQMIQEILPQLPPEIIQEVVPQLPPEIIPAVVPQLPPEILPAVVPQLPPEILPAVVPQLPPEIIPAVIPQLPPQIMPDIINGILPILPPEIIQQMLPQLPPEVLPAVIPQLPAVDVSAVDEFIIPPEVEPDFVSAVEPDFLRIPPPLDREPQVIDEIAQIEKVDKSTPVKENPYEKVFIPQIPEFNPNDPTFIPKFDPTPPPEAPPPPPLPPIVPPEDPIVPPEDPIYVPGPDPIITPPPEDITLPVIPPPPEEYQPKEPMYTPREVIKNPSQGNLIDQQRRAYNSNLSNLVYQAPDIVRDEYVRPMSAAQFGSAPGSAEDVRTPVYKDPPQFIAMNRGGSVGKPGYNRKDSKGHKYDAENISLEDLGGLIKGYEQISDWKYARKQLPWETGPDQGLDLDIKRILMEGEFDGKTEEELERERANFEVVKEFADNPYLFQTFDDPNINVMGAFGTLDRGEYEKPEVPSGKPGYNRKANGGSINLNNSSMNRGIGQLPPMQQQDKLTQLFQSSFRPRR